MDLMKGMRTWLGQKQLTTRNAFALQKRQRNQLCTLGIMFHSALIIFLLIMAQEYSCTYLSWRRLEAQGFSSSGLFAGFVHYRGELFLYGGEGNQINSSSEGALESDTWSLSLSGTPPEWRHVTTTTDPRAKLGMVGGIVGDYWIITHGCNLGNCFAETWYMNLSAASPDWVLLSNISGSIPEARFTVAGGIFPGSSQLWMSMGESMMGRKLSDTWVLELDVTDGISGVWREVSPGGGLNQYNPTLPHARSLHTGAPINDSTFVIFGGCASGGGVGGPCPLGDSWALDLETANWSPLPTCAPAAVRANMIAIPNSPGKAFLLGGSETYAPGLFPQQIQSSHGYNTSTAVVYLLSIDREEVSWKGVVIHGGFPQYGKGASMTTNSKEGVVYLIGGRALNESSFLVEVWELSGDGHSDASADCPASQITYVHVHGIIMCMAWGILLPLGALLGRYYRWTWPIWYILHVILQSLGVALTVGGVFLIFIVGSLASPNFVHAALGIFLAMFVIQQFLSGIFHPCMGNENGKIPGNKKSVFRKCWEYYHASSGFLAIAFGFVELTLGLLLVGVSQAVRNWWLVVAVLWILLFILHEVIYIINVLRRKRQ